MAGFGCEGHRFEVSHRVQSTPLPASSVHLATLRLTWSLFFKSHSHLDCIQSEKRKDEILKIKQKINREPTSF